MENFIRSTSLTSDLTIFVTRPPASSRASIAPRISLRILYNSLFFTHTRITTIVDQLSSFLRRVSSNPVAPIGAIPLLTPLNEKDSQTPPLTSIGATGRVLSPMYSHEMPVNGRIGVCYSKSTSALAFRSTGEDHLFVWSNKTSFQHLGTPSAQRGYPAGRGRYGVCSSQRGSRGGCNGRVESRSHVLCNWSLLFPPRSLLSSKSVDLRSCISCFASDHLPSCYPTTRA